MATLRDIAERARVSQVTVSNVLNVRNKEKWPAAAKRAARIRRIAEELGYRPSAAARSMRRRGSRQIAAVLFNCRENLGYNRGVFEMLAGANLRLEDEVYLLTLVRLADLARDPALRSRGFREDLFEGAMAFGLPDEAAPIVPCIQETFPSCIWVDGLVWEPRNCVRRDEEAAGRMAAKALMRGGSTQLLWPANPGANHYSYRLRLAGAREAAGGCLEEVDPRLLWQPSRRGRSSSPLQAAQRGVGVIAHDMLCAQLIAHPAGSHGLIPGRDFALVCCESTAGIMEAWPDLSRVNFNRFRMGERAAEMVLARIAGQTDLPSLCIPDGWREGATYWNPKKGTASLTNNQ